MPQVPSEARIIAWAEDDELFVKIATTKLENKISKPKIN
jgi:hypothetical protein